MSNQEVGIDIQQHKVMDTERIAKVFLSSYEQSVIQEAENKLAAFADFWTIRESYVKLTGTGLHKALSQLSINEDQTGWFIRQDNRRLAVHFRHYPLLPAYSICSCTNDKVIFDIPGEVGWKEILETLEKSNRAH